MDPFLAEALTLGFEAEQILAEVQKRLGKLAQADADFMMSRKLGYEP